MYTGKLNLQGDKKNLPDYNYGKIKMSSKESFSQFLLVSFFTAIETLQVLVIQQGHFILQYANSSKILLMRVMEKEF